MNEYIKNGVGHGPVSNAIANGVNLQQFRTNASLPKDAWEYLDEAIIRLARQELIGINDIRSIPGAVIPFDGLGASLFTMNRVDGLSGAVMAETPDVRNNGDTLNFDTIGTPLPITVKDFPINTKRAAMARRDGVPYESIISDEALYQVMYKLEDHLFNGQYIAGGSTAWGYTTFPKRQQYTLPVSWATQQPDLMFNDVNAMVTKSMEHHHYGPWTLYIPWQYYSRLNQDYHIGAIDFPHGIIRDRFMDIPGLEDVKVSRFLANNNVVLVEKSARTVRLIDGITPTVVDWTMPNSPNWTHNFKAMAMWVPFFVTDKDANGNEMCGIVHGHL